MADEFMLKEFCIDKAYGLHDVHIILDNHVIFMGGMNGSGRTRALTCLKGMFIMFGSMYRCLPDTLERIEWDGDERKVTRYIDSNSRMWMVLECVDAGVDKKKSPDVRINFEFDDDGHVSFIFQTYEDDAWVTREYDDYVHDTRYWCAELGGIVDTPGEAMRHMADLPRDILGVLGIDDGDSQHMLSGTLGKLVPWLSLMSPSSDECLYVLDDVFENVHPLIVDNFLNSMDDFMDTGKVSTRRVIISSRRYADMIAKRRFFGDMKFYFFEDGTAKLCESIGYWHPAVSWLHMMNGDYDEWVKEVEKEMEE